MTYTDKQVDLCTPIPYIRGMEIWTIRHKGLRRLIEDDDSRGIRPDLTMRIRSVLGACAAERFWAPSDTISSGKK